MRAEPSIVIILKYRSTMEKILGVTEKLTELGLDAATPPWAKILINCVNELVDAVKQYNVLNDRMAKLEDISEVRKTVIEGLQEENTKLRNELKFVKRVTDQNEQKSRSICLLIHGVEEEQGEDTDKLSLDIIEKEIGVPISLSDIERTHRTGPKRQITTRQTKARPIIVRFNSMRKRMEVYANKKKLKGKKYVVTESLTALRMRLLAKAKEEYGVKNVWTVEGKILVKKDGNISLFSSEIDDII